MKVFSLVLFLLLITFSSLSGKVETDHLWQPDATFTPVAQFNRETIDVGNVDKLSRVSALQLQESVSDIVWSPDGTRIAVTVPSGVEIYNANGLSKPSKSFRIRTNPVSISPDWKLLASVGADNTIEVWNIEQEKRIATLKGHTASVGHLAFSPNGKLLASAGGEIEDRTIRLWDLDLSSQVALLEGHTSHITGIAFSPTNGLLASASDDNTVRLWRVPGGTQLATLRKHTNTVTGLTFSPDGLTLISTSIDRSAILWDTTKYSERYIFSALSPDIKAAFSPDGSILALDDVEDDDAGIVTLRDSSSGAKKAELKGQHGPHISSAFNPRGTLIATFGDGNVRLWNTQTGVLLYTMRDNESNFVDLVFNPQGTLIARSNGNGTIEIWGIQRR